MMALIIESTGRSLLLALAAYLLMRALKIRNERFELTVWRMMLTAVLLMPFVLRVLPISLPVEVEVPSVLVAVDSIAAAAPSSAWTDVVTIAYLSVTLLLLLRLLVGILAAWKLYRNGTVIRVAHHRGVELRVGKSLTSPVTIGSTVMLPPDFATWGSYKFEAVIAHEAAHVRNRDFYWHAAALIYRAIFWMNPMAWWLPKRMTELAESRSDEIAVKAVGNRLAYAEVLLGLSRQPVRAIFAVAMARGADLERRVASLIEGGEASVATFTKKALVGTLGLAALVACASCERSVTTQGNASPVQTAENRTASTESDELERLPRESSAAESVAKIKEPTLDPDHPLSNPRYLESEKKAQHEGVVMLSLLIDTDGRVSKSRIKKSSGYELLDQEAEAHARGYWRMRPGTKNGEPTERWVIVPVKFKLAD